jgi:ribosomal protein S18 acetylase RimI-like enzyme
VQNVFIRPDRRRFLRGDPNDIPDGDVFVTVAELDVARYERLGFVVNRREDEYLVSTDRYAGAPPPGFVFRRADGVDEERLRRLDDALRQDVPGTDGWRWDAADFRAETFESSAFDPATYLVAVDVRDDYVGLSRVWTNRPVPRLSMVGVLAPYRRRGLAKALLEAVFGELHARGVAEVSTEVDETNVASQALLAGFGIHRIAGHVELVRRASSRL